MQTRKLPYFVRNMFWILVVILSFKIAGYFSIVENRTVNQIYKTIVRAGMTGAILWIYISLRRMGSLGGLRYTGLLSIYLYIAYLLLGLISVCWSTDPGYSLLQWSMTFESFAFIFLFIQVLTIYNLHFKTRKLNLSALMEQAVFPILFIFLIGSFAMPDIFWRSMRGGEETRLGGYLMNPNELGMLASIGAALLMIRLLKEQARFWLFIRLGIVLWVLILTSSRSSVVGFALVSCVLILQSSHKKLKLYMLSLAAIALPVLIKLIVFKADGGVEEVMTMTGRLPFWKALLNEGIVKEPFFGYGFMRINYTDYFQGLNTYPGKMTHNTFMQVLMNLGFVGLFIALWQLVLTVRNYILHTSSEVKIFFLAIFIPILINSFTEFGIFGETNYGILFYQFLFFLLVTFEREAVSVKERVRAALFRKEWQSQFEPDLE